MISSSRRLCLILGACLGFIGCNEPATWTADPGDADAYGAGDDGDATLDGSKQDALADGDATTDLSPETIPYDVGTDVIDEASGADVGSDVLVVDSPPDVDGSDASPLDGLLDSAGEAGPDTTTADIAFDVLPDSSGDAGVEATGDSAPDASDGGPGCSTGWTAMAAVPTGFDARGSYTVAWTGGRMIVWGGSSSGLHHNDGAAYDPASDSWAMVPVSPLAARGGHSAVWTGTKMLVWGGVGGTTTSPSLWEDGAAFDPLTSKWSAIALSGAPSKRYQHSAVWTGSEMIVWGGRDFGIGDRNDGARYNPSTDTWTALPSVPVGVVARRNHAAVWTAGRMIIWGGEGGLTADGLSDGAAYDPSSDSWKKLPTVPSGVGRRFGMAAAATGPSPKGFVMWGGYGEDVAASTFQTLENGAVYELSTDAWTAIASPGEIVMPNARRLYPSSWWTNGRLWIFGGFTNGTSPVTAGTGALYDVATSTWTALPLTGSPPSPRALATAVWTGSQAIVWGGTLKEYLGGLSFKYTILNDGSIYCP